MEIDYTAKFEKFLDKIAQGKAKWATVLDNYYKMFSPMVVKLMEDAKHLTNLNQTEDLGPAEFDKSEDVDDRSIESSVVNEKKLKNESTGELNDIPFVRSVIQTFPGAEITNVRDLSSTETSNKLLDDKNLDNLDKIKE